jgi:hypothetical protein
MLAGAVLVLAPLALWILANLQDFSGQQRLLASRYAAYDPRFLAVNLLAEAQRYRTLLPPDLTAASVLARPALWIGAPFGLIACARLLRHGARGRHGLEFAVAMTLLANVLLLALLLQVKTWNYVIAFWPLAVLVLTAGAVDLWRAGRLASRALLALALTVVLAEGALAVRSWRVGGRAVTAYAVYTSRIAEHLPAGAHVLGLQRWWLGLQPLRYTSWLLPVWQSDARFTDNVRPLDAAIDGIAPDFILMDSAMAAWFESISSPAHADHARSVQWQAYQRRHNVTLVAVVADATYGEVRVLRID